MHTIDLKNNSLRTDLIIDEISRNQENKIETKKIIEKENIVLEEIKVYKELEKELKKKPGIYRTVTFKDVTDKNNFKEVEQTVITALKKTYEDINLTKDSKVLVIGLGNEESTPDSLGPKSINHILVTRHLFLLGEVEEGYRNVASFKPSVTGVTGIETKDLIEGITEKIKPDLLIVIDALASNSIDRLNKTIQITTSGISPGSGIGNNRVEISKETMNIPVIALGVPTVVEATTIVQDTLQLLLKQISYKMENQQNMKLKLIPNESEDYQKHEEKLSDKEKEDVLGMVGLLNEQELKKLLLEVLIPVNYNMMVTPKEIDYVIEKLSLLIGNAINKSLHEHFNPTN